MTRYPTPDGVAPHIWEQFSALAECARTRGEGFTELDVAEEVSVDRATARHLLGLLEALSHDDPDPGYFWWKRTIVQRRVWLWRWRE